jgi:hypothetical protein
MASIEAGKVCGPQRKQCYPTKAVARMKAAEGMKNGAPRLWVYKCPHCRDWHMTSQAPRHPTG